MEGGQLFVSLILGLYINVSDFGRTLALRLILNEATTDVLLQFFDFLRLLTSQSDGLLQTLVGC